MLHGGFGTSASNNLGAGADGKVAAHTQSSVQKAASRYLRRLGRGTCGAGEHAQVKSRALLPPS